MGKKSKGSNNKNKTKNKSKNKSKTNYSSNNSSGRDDETMKEKKIKRLLDLKDDFKYSTTKWLDEIFEVDPDNSIEGKAQIVGSRITGAERLGKSLKNPFYHAQAGRLYNDPTKYAGKCDDAVYHFKRALNSSSGIVHNVKSDERDKGAFESSCKVGIISAYLQGNRTDEAMAAFPDSPGEYTIVAEMMENSNYMSYNKLIQIARCYHVSDNHLKSQEYYQKCIDTTIQEEPGDWYRDARLADSTCRLIRSFADDRKLELGFSLFDGFLKEFCHTLDPEGLIKFGKELESKGLAGVSHQIKSEMITFDPSKSSKTHIVPPPDRPRKKNKNKNESPKIKAVLDLGKDLNYATDTWFKKIHRVDPRDKIQGKAFILENRLINAEEAGEKVHPTHYCTVARLFGDSDKYPSGCDKSVSYFRKALVQATQARPTDKSMESKCMQGIIDTYIQFGKVDAALSSFPDHPVEYRKLATEMESSLSQLESDRDNDALVPEAHYRRCLKAAVGFQASRLPNAFTKAQVFYKKSIASAKGNVQVTGELLRHKRVIESYRCWILCCLDYEEKELAHQVFDAFLNELNGDMDLWRVMKISHEFESRGLLGISDKLHKMIADQFPSTKDDEFYDHKVKARKTMVALKLTKFYEDFYQNYSDHQELKVNRQLALYLTYLHKNRGAMNSLKVVLACGKKTMDIKSTEYANLCFDTYLHMGYLHLDYGKSQENANKMFELARKRLARIDQYNTGARVLSLAIGKACASFDLGDVDGALSKVTSGLQAVESSNEKFAMSYSALAHLYAASFIVERYRRMSFATRWRDCKKVIDEMGFHVQHAIKLYPRIGGDLNTHGQFPHPPYTDLSLLNVSLQIDLLSATTVVLVSLPGLKTQPSFTRQQIFDHLRPCFKTMHKEAMDGQCHSSKQRDGVGVKLMRCSECKVCLYCNTKHQRKKRRERFFLHSHKFFCPYLKRWHIVHKAMQKRHGISDSCEKIMTDFINEMVHELTYIKEEYRPCDKKVRAGTL